MTQKKIDIEATLLRLDAIANQLVVTGEKAREDRLYDLSIGAFVQATSVVVTAHQLEERHLYLEHEASGETEETGEAESQQGSGGIRGRHAFGSDYRGYGEATG